MILKFKDFINEAYQGPIVVQNKPTPNPDFIYFRNTIQKEIWDKVILPKVLDNHRFKTGRTVSAWEMKNHFTSAVDGSNPRLTKQIYETGFPNIKDVVSAYGDEMISIAQLHFPNYNKRSLITDLNDIADILKSAAKHYHTAATAVAKKRILKGFDDKDVKRITDMVTKANKLDKLGNTPSNDEVIRRKKTLASMMAKAIDDGAKALRRAKAAEAEGEDDIASIFYGRVADLNFGDQWRASTTLRELNKKTGIFDDDFDLDDPDQ